MRLPEKTRIAGLALVAVMVVLGCGSAIAYFTSEGEGAVAAGVSNLSKPVISSATPAIGGTVTVTWGAVTPPQTGTVTYYVSRDGEPAAGTCPTSSAPTTVTTCVDKEVDPGAHSYTVTAVWRSWTAESAAKAATVTVGAPTHFTLAAASTTPVAAVGDNLTITAKDVNEATVTTYTGAKSLTFSGAAASPSGSAATVTNSSGTAVAFGSATSINFTSGTTVITNTTRNGQMKVFRAGAASIAVTDGSIGTDNPLAISVSPAALSKFVLAAETLTPAAGDPDDLTITAQDTYGNVVVGHEGVKSLTFAATGTTSPAGNVATVTDNEGTPVAFGTATPIEFVAGVATTSGSANGEMRLYKTGSQSVKFTEGAISSNTLTAVPPVGTAVKLTLTASTVTPVVGASVTLTITAQDVYGNTVTTYTGSKNLVFSGASASPAGNAPTVTNSSNTAIAFGSTTAITFTSGVGSRTLRLYRAGPAALSTTDGTLGTETPLATTASATTHSKFAIAAETTTPVAGAADDLTITATDTYGNTIASYAGTKSFIFSGASSSPAGNAPTVTDAEGKAIPFGTATPLEFVAGVATSDGALNGEMRLYKTTSSAVVGTEGSLSGTKTFVPTAATAAKFTIGSSATTIAANGTASLTTTAQDAYGNTATGYTGTKSLVFSGASASASGSSPTVVDKDNVAINFGSETAITFTSGIAAAASNKNGLVRLFRSGVTPVAVTDGTISSAAPVNITVTAGGAAKLVFPNLKVSAGSIAANCWFACTITGLGNSGTIKSDVAATDTYGNISSSIGTGHSVAVTIVSGEGSIASGTFTFPSTGLAESATEFTYTSKASGSFTASLKAATTAGTAYTNATISATK